MEQYTHIAMMRKFMQDFEISFEMFIGIILMGADRPSGVPWPIMRKTHIWSFQFMGHRMSGMMVS